MSKSIVEKYMQAMSEIIDYLKANKGTSYYDIKEIAYSEKKKDWISVLENRKQRHVVSICCRDLQRANQVPYRRSMYESARAANEAETAYYRNCRH